MTKRSKTLLTFVIIVGILFTLFLIFLVPVNYGDLFKGDSIINGIFIALPILFAVLFVILLTYFINQESLIKTIQLENLNVLGKKSEFNNLYAFQKEVMP